MCGTERERESQTAFRTNFDNQVTFEDFGHQHTLNPDSKSSPEESGGNSGGSACLDSRKYVLSDNRLNFKVK